MLKKLEKELPPNSHFLSLTQTTRSAQERTHMSDRAQGENKTLSIHSKSSYLTLFVAHIEINKPSSSSLFKQKKKKKKKRPKMKKKKKNPPRLKIT